MSGFRRGSDIISVVDCCDQTLRNLAERGDIPRPLMVHRRLALWREDEVAEFLPRLIARYGVRVRA